MHSSSSMLAQIQRAHVRHGSHMQMRLSHAKPVHAALVAFLASPAAAYMTGQTIAIDGGYSVMGFYGEAAGEGASTGSRF